MKIRPKVGLTQEDQDIQKRANKRGQGVIATSMRRDDQRSFATMQSWQDDRKDKLRSILPARSAQIDIACLLDLSC